MCADSYTKHSNSLRPLRLPLCPFIVQSGGLSPRFPAQRWQPEWACRAKLDFIFHLNLAR
jgi:hypothetical protein